MRGVRAELRGRVAHNQDMCSNRIESNRFDSIRIESSSVTCTLPSQIGPKSLDLGAWHTSRWAGRQCGGRRPCHLEGVRQAFLKDPRSKHGLIHVVGDVSKDNLPGHFHTLLDLLLPLQPLSPPLFIHHGPDTPSATSTSIIIPPPSRSHSPTPKLHGFNATITLLLLLLLLYIIPAVSSLHPIRCLAPFFLRPFICSRLFDFAEYRGWAEGGGHQEGRPRRTSVKEPWPLVSPLLAPFIVTLGPGKISCRINSSAPGGHESLS